MHGRIAQTDNACIGVNGFSRLWSPWLRFSASLYKRMGGVHIATVGALWSANFSHVKNARKRNGAVKFA